MPRPLVPIPPFDRSLCIGSVEREECISSYSMPVYRVDTVAGEDGRSLGPHSSHGSTRRRPPPDPLRAALRKSAKRRARGGAASLRPDPDPITKGEGGHEEETHARTDLYVRTRESVRSEGRLHANAANETWKSEIQIRAELPKSRRCPKREQPGSLPC